MVKVIIFLASIVFGPYLVSKAMLYIVAYIYAILVTALCDDDDARLNRETGFMVKASEVFADYVGEKYKDHKLYRKTKINLEFCDLYSDLMFHHVNSLRKENNSSNETN